MISLKTDSNIEGTKRRGRPPGSKNKNKKNVILPSKSKAKKNRQTTSNSSVEATIRHLLDLPTSTETKVLLIKAMLDGKG